MNINEIKAYLTEKKYDALLITRNNQFLGQDILENENRIQALTGFKGSAGSLIITPQKAFLFVDGRYEIQAKQQTNAEEVEVICGRANIMTQWLKETFNGRAKIEYNSWCVSAKQIDRWKAVLPKIKFMAKPELSELESAHVFAHEQQYCGKTCEEKKKEVIDFLNKYQCKACLICAADSASWLTNLRSDALPDTPVARMMVLIKDSGELTLFADNLEFPTDNLYKILPLSKLDKELSALKEQNLALDLEYTPDAIRKITEKYDIKIRNLLDPGLSYKAIKNETEIKGIINAHLRDGIAVCKLLYWLEQNKSQELNEYDVVEKIHELRRQQPLFYSDSFPTIAGSGSNAAVIHYQPEKESCAPLSQNSVLLLDTGGQYFNGTTDITRTIAVGAPSKEMIEKFTIVLKAHITLASAHFPNGVSGLVLDTICRSIMWRQNLDYKHGTGHGVGCFLNVHEGPQNLSTSGANYPISKDMIVSIEPGYYLEGAFGIRIENLARIIEDEQSQMLKFEILSLVPIDKRLIDKYLLRSEEIEWLNKYHQNVYQKISPYLEEDEKIWLKEACSSL